MDYHLLPRFLQYELTYGCNSACTFCYNPTHRRQLDDEIRYRVLDAINEYRIDHVQLIGGEVTILPGLPSYLDRLTKIRWRSVVTNGRIYVPELAGRVNEIYLSLHGDRELHEAMTRARGSFEVIEESIRSYVAAGIEVHSDTVLTRLNAHMIFDIAARAKGLGMSSIFVNIFQPAGLGARKALDLSPSIGQIREAITQMLRAHRELGVEVHFGTSTPFCFDERLITEGLAFTCGTGDWFASIDPWGELRTCNQSRRSYGNVLTDPLGRIWQSSLINVEYRSLGWIDEPCRSCVFKHECLGGCRVGDNGKPRLDPIVVRDREHLLPQDRLVALKEVYTRTRYSQPYTSRGLSAPAQAG